MARNPEINTCSSLSYVFRRNSMPGGGVGKSQGDRPPPFPGCQNELLSILPTFLHKAKAAFHRKRDCIGSGGALRSLRKVSLLHASLINKRLGSSSWLTAGLGVNLLGTLVRKMKGERPRLNISGTVCLLVHSPPPTQLGKHGFIGKIAACEARASLKMGCGEALK